MKAIVFRIIVISGLLVFVSGCDMDAKDTGEFCSSHGECEEVCYGEPDWGICVIRCGSERACPEETRCFEINAPGLGETTVSVCIPNCEGIYCKPDETICDLDGSCARRYPCTQNRQCPRYSCRGDSIRLCIDNYCYPQAYTCEKHGEE